MLDLWEYTELERRLNALCAVTNGYLEFRSALPLFQISSVNWTWFFKFKFTAVCCLCRLGSRIFVCWSARCLSVSMRSTTMVLARTWSAQNRKCREICLCYAYRYTIPVNIYKPLWTSNLPNPNVLASKIQDHQYVNALMCVAVLSSFKHIFVVWFILCVL
jgi:hypothetical protein